MHSVVCHKNINKTSCWYIEHLPAVWQTLLQLHTHTMECWGYISCREWCCKISLVCAYQIVYPFIFTIFSGLSLAFFISTILNVSLYFRYLCYNHTTQINIQLTHIALVCTNMWWRKLSRLYWEETHPSDLVTRWPSHLSNSFIERCRLNLWEACRCVMWPRCPYRRCRF